MSKHLSGFHIYFKIYQKDFKKLEKSREKLKSPKIKPKENQNSKSSKASFHESSMGLKIGRNTQNESKSN